MMTNEQQDPNIRPHDREPSGLHHGHRDLSLAAITRRLACSRVRWASLVRHDPEALIVDIRPQAQRAREGEVPGALIIERNVLEWRLDPTSEARHPEARGDDVRWIFLCQEGFTSSLAAAALHDLGLHRATDVAGGFRAWREAGLATRGGGSPAAG